jgi:1-deoxy-D-xylulose-5-phosphate reductoisomerase
VVWDNPPVTSIVILGSTGSIGKQTLDVAARHPNRIRIVGLAAGSNEAALAEQSSRHPSAKAVLYSRDGMQAMTDLATMPEADVVVVSVAGVIGLLPTIEAIGTGKRIALASKEVLVAAGEIVMPLAKEHGVELVPIDSEHSALFQCLQGYRTDQIDELILTASGGPFRGWTLDELGKVTVEQALNHPTWNMGGKITVDSATMMNKALETIEAMWLFGVEIDQVRIVVHPQSIIHSMVKLRDGSVLGQMGWPDMRIPIQYALLYPHRVPSELPPWSPIDSPSLTFEALDETVFRGPSLARQASKTGGTMPAVMNAANEEAANAFLRGEMAFLEVTNVVEAAMGHHSVLPATLETILEADAEARRFVRESK